MKLKEEVGLWGFYIILAKKRRFGLQEMMNHMEVTRKYAGELTEDKVLF